MADLRLVTVPWESGHRGRRMGAGPDHLLAAGIADDLRSRRHSVDHVAVDCSTPFPTEVSTGFELARALSARVGAALEDGRRPLVLAGGCYSAVGTVAGLVPDDLAVFWFDAHGDLNTPESTASGFVDGMAASTLLGRCWTTLAAAVPGFVPVSPERVVFVALRDLDPPEKAYLSQSAATVVKVDEIRTAGASGGLQSAVDRLARAGARRSYVHVDLDAIDPGEARVNAFQAPGGLTTAELCASIRAIGARLPVAGGALTSFDPSVDPEGRGTEAALQVLRALAEA